MVEQQLGYVFKKYIHASQVLLSLKSIDEDYSEVKDHET